MVVWWRLPIVAALYSMDSNSPRYPLFLLGIYAVIWMGLAIAPHYRDDWLLENVLVVLALPLFVLGYHHLRFSNRAYTQLFAFMVLHAIGAHYTYAEVPYDGWFRALTGTGFNELFGWQRNHFDRLVHFMYGFLLFRLVWELFAARAKAVGIWRYLLPLGFIFSHGMIFELIEWMAAEWFGGDLGEAYLGTQGDSWDAHKDMALAALGSVLALGIVLLGERRSAVTAPMVSARMRRS